MKTTEWKFAICLVIMMFSFSIKSQDAEYTIIYDIYTASLYKTPTEFQNWIEAQSDLGVFGKNYNDCFTYLVRAWNQRSVAHEQSCSGYPQGSLQKTQCMSSNIGGHLLVWALDITSVTGKVKRWPGTNSSQSQEQGCRTLPSACMEMKKLNAQVYRPWLVCSITY